MGESKFFSPEAEKKIEESRKRVGKLKETDNPYQDSVYDLALEENRFREEMKKDDLSKEIIEKYANRYSDLIVEKLEAEKENWQDALTGLRNKRALQEEIPGLLGLEKRNNQECSLLMLDLDFFKKINDEIGHVAGDQALKIIADIIKSSVRKSDFVYRFGGEEFAVFLLNTNKKLAVEIAEKIRKEIEKANIIVLDEKGANHRLKKTISVGVVSTEEMDSWNDDKDDEWEDVRDEMIGKADKALYASKETGRNKVTSYGPDLNEKYPD